MNIFFKKTKDAIKLLPVLAIALFFLLASCGTSLALGGNVSGFAWGAVDSDNSGTYTPGTDGGMGWLSFSQSSDFPTDVPNNFYQVDLDPSTGDFSGYAWSPNIGWVSFDAGCPSSFGNGNNNSVCSAKVTNFQNGTVAGWARACGAFQSGCAGALNSNAGGWDGWIEMSGVNHPTGFFDNNGSPIPSTSRGVTFDIVTGQFSGFAWGGNSLDGHNDIGWISFGAGPDPVVTGGNTSNLGCPSNLSSCPAPTSELFISSLDNPTALLPSLTINAGEQVILSWNSSNVGTCQSYTKDSLGNSISTNSWDAFSPQIIFHGTSQMTPVNPNTDPLNPISVIYYFKCFGLYNQSLSHESSVVVSFVPVVVGSEDPTVWIQANPPQLIQPGTTTTLTFGTSSTDDFTGCTLLVSDSNGNSDSVIFDSSQIPTTTSTGIMTVTVPYLPATYTLECIDSTGAVATDEVTVTQLQLSANVNFGQATNFVGPYNPGAVDLSWLGSNIDTSSCVLSWTATNGQSGQIQNATSPQSAVPLYLSGPPSNTQTTYTISCTPINNATPMNPDPLIPGNTKDGMTITAHTPPGGGPNQPPIFEEF